MDKNLEYHISGKISASGSINDKMVWRSIGEYIQKLSSKKIQEMWSGRKQKEKKEMKRSPY